jgi:hypothetical protein
MMTGEGLDSSLARRCFFSLMTDLARSYIDIFGVDGVIDLGAGGRETGETGDDDGVERINGGGFEGIGGEIDGGVEGSVGGGNKGGGWKIRTAGGVERINEGGDEGIGSDGEMWIDKGGTELTAA